MPIKRKNKKAKSKSHSQSPDVKDNLDRVVSQNATYSMLVAGDSNCPPTSSNMYIEDKSSSSRNLLSFLSIRGSQFKKKSRSMAQSSQSLDHSILVDNRSLISDSSQTFPDYSLGLDRLSVEGTTSQKKKKTSVFLIPPTSDNVRDGELIARSSSITDNHIVSNMDVAATFQKDNDTRSSIEDSPAMVATTFGSELSVGRTTSQKKKNTSVFSIPLTSDDIRDGELIARSSAYTDETIVIDMEDAATSQKDNITRSSIDDSPAMVATTSVDPSELSVGGTIRSQKKKTSVLSIPPASDDIRDGELIARSSSITDKHIVEVAATSQNDTRSSIEDSPAMVATTSMDTSELSVGGTASLKKKKTSVFSIPPTSDDIRDGELIARSSSITDNHIVEVAATSQNDTRSSIDDSPAMVATTSMDTSEKEATEHVTYIASIKKALYFILSPDDVPVARLNALREVLTSDAVHILVRDIGYPKHVLYLTVVHDYLEGHSTRDIEAVLTSVTKINQLRIRDHDIFVLIETHSPDIISFKKRLKTILKERSKESLSCTHCHKKVVSVLYLPCGHIILCNDCMSKSVTVCQSCGTTIAEYHQVFF